MIRVRCCIAVRWRHRDGVAVGRLIFAFVAGLQPGTGLGVGGYSNGLPYDAYEGGGRKVPRADSSRTYLLGRDCGQALARKLAPSPHRGREARPTPPSSSRHPAPSASHYGCTQALISLPLAPARSPCIGNPRVLPKKSFKSPSTYSWWTHRVHLTVHLMHKHW